MPRHLFSDEEWFCFSVFIVEIKCAGYFAFLFFQVLCGVRDVMWCALTEMWRHLIVTRVLLILLIMDLLVDVVRY